jgi:uncharacterized membrane protein HdeD (DUF308 family)
VSQRVGRAASRTWWWFLVTGIAWLVVAVVVLRFDLTSIAAVGAMLGVFLLLAGLNEVLVAGTRGAGWRWLHAIMAVVFIVAGVWAFIHPIGAFYELAAILGFVLVFKGAIDIAMSAAAHDVNELWWLGLIVGLLEVLLGFWASQQFFAPRALLIITWVGLSALLRGVGEIVLAFEVRRVGRDLSRQEAPQSDAGSRE